jgi:hypothetical protein
MPGGTFPWYAVIVSERGVPKAMVLTALEWQHDQTPGPFSAQFKLIGGFNTKKEAQDAADKFNNLPNPKKLDQAGIPSAPDLPNPLHGIDAIGDFFQRLTQPATWARVGEVALGGILVYVAVRALAHGAPSSAAKPVTRPAQRAATKVAGAVVPEARLATRIVAKKAAPKTTARVSAHRQQVRQYGAKKPYAPPARRPPARTPPTKAKP